MLDKEDPSYILSIQAHEILKNPDQVYDLAGKRLALTSLKFKDHFSNPDNTFRLAVVGNPNLGKTTYSYSVAKILELYGTKATYVDLDVYTKSGDAISGKIDWTKREKRTSNDIPAAEIEENISNFADAKPGIVIGDFPGLVSNPYQGQRLSKASLALIFGKDLAEIGQWQKLCNSRNVKYRFAISTQKHLTSPIIYPQINSLERKVVFSSQMLVSATSILLEASELTNGPKINFDNYFTQPELVVLEEVLSRRG